MSPHISDTHFAFCILHLYRGAWSATAAGGGLRERDKGENKEHKTPQVA